MKKVCNTMETSISRTTHLDTFVLAPFKKNDLIISLLQFLQVKTEVLFLILILILILKQMS